MIFVLIFLGGLVITGGYALALFFHWFKYGATMPMVWVALPIYLVGTGILFLLNVAALTALTL